MFIHAVPDNRGKKDGYFCSLVESTRINGKPTHTGALVLGDVNWLGVLSAGAFGFVTALLIALTGLPEVENESFHG